MWWTKLLLIGSIAGIVCGMTLKTDSLVKTTNSPNMEETKPLKISSKFHKFKPTEWFQPFSDAVSTLVTLSQHPNFGGIQHFSPQHLWELIHEKKGSYFTGPYGAVFGLSHKKETDYPFAYRSVTSKVK